MMELVALPNVLEFNDVPDGWGRKEWVHPRASGCVDHYLFVHFRCGDLLWRARVESPVAPRCFPKIGRYEMFVKTPDIFQELDRI